MSSAPVIRAPRGNQLHCKNWVIEAAYRMIQNNLDPEVAENPAELVVYGGIGKAARNWESFYRILDFLMVYNIFALFLLFLFFYSFLNQNLQQFL